jgi:CPA1 family monovalent cation:H+ antiporter
MRGGVSLAAAMSIPVAADGHAFPGRDEIVFLTYMVVLATLVVPGLTLGPLVRRLEVGAGEGQRRDERARAQILRAALADLEQSHQIGSRAAREIEQDLELERREYS